MVIKRFCAEGFRNIERCDIPFLEGVNLLYGNNAQGKTNVVEGIYIFARGKSFRAREDSELCSFGSEGYRLYVEYSDKNGDNTLELAHFGRQRRRKKNGYPLKSVREIMGNLRCVLFIPDDLSLVKESPEERRAFLNVAIGQLDGVYIDDYSRYKSALENRNCILRNASKGRYYDGDELISWSEQMAKYASYIYMCRRDYIKKLEVYASDSLREISSGEERLSLLYKSDIEGDISDREEIERIYRERLTSNIEKEKIVGSSLYGPHRDDMEIFINGVSARSFASQGQQRSVVLSLKLGEGEVCRSCVGEYPVYLFDDVLSELDGVRREYLLSRLSGKQIIITSCESEGLTELADSVIRVTGGRYERS